MSMREPSSTGLAQMVQIETQDLSALGNRAAIAMCGTDSSYRAFQAASQIIFDGLRDDVEQVRIYLLDPVERILREEAVVDHFGSQEGADLIPLYQFPEQITKKLAALQHNMGDQWEIQIPLPGEQQIAGVLVLVSFQKFPPHLEEKILRLGRSLALGALYVRRSREAERSAMLLKAVTNTSAKLQGLEGRTSLLENFVTTAVESFGFDRATIFVLDDDGRTVKTALCARAGVGVIPVTAPPELQLNSDQPAPHPHLPGLWIPIRMGSRRLGALFVDNIYSLEPPSRDVLQPLVDLASQAALALENARLIERLRETALRDDLTGLYRSGYFLERVREELANSRRRKDSTGLVMIDLDQFKAINDTYGHPIGDEVLIRVADRIRQSLRVGDTACRKGGDEFIILVPNLTGEQAGRMAQRLIDEIRASPVALPDGRLVEISVSAGVALFPSHAGNWQDLWARADEALYQAKNGGRGRWVLWTSQGKMPLA
ncbi:MAG: sensor domain-containing diguanylate cyclase [Fibrobacterota bacterium]|nr:sensor domain-containing diguanylate cyclase [Fibrobacterota bacterium]QQS07333.1 MAG: sensor domain-containing diguanylate cyclase [Fibrobacterota bacterium]